MTTAVARYHRANPSKPITSDIDDVAAASVKPVTTHRSRPPSPCRPGSGTAVAISRLPMGGLLFYALARAAHQARMTPQIGTLLGTSPSLDT
jgi:hypothetical protein